MKELSDPLKQLQPEIIKEIKAEQEKELKYLGSIVLKPGHRLWGVNMNTFEVQECEFVGQEARMLTTGEVITRRKYVIKPDTFYTSALNAANAFRHFLRNYKRRAR